MESKRIGFTSLFLVVMLIALAALPAWGGSFQKKGESFGNMALVTQTGDKHNVLGLQDLAVFSSPVTALAQISKWCGAPSADNPCLIKILPGVYNLGTGSLTMQPFVDIEGSGESTTVITSAYNSSTMTGVVNGANNSELRFLTVKNTASADYVIAIANKGTSPKLTYLTAISSGARKLGCGIYNSGASPVLTHLTAIAEKGFYSYGIYNAAGSNPMMTDITASAQASSTAHAIHNSASAPIMNTVNATAKGPGAFEACAISNEASSAPVMNNIIATGQDGHFSYAILNNASSPVVRSAILTAAGHYSRGVENQGSTLFMTDADITAITGTVNYGIISSGSKLTLNNVTTKAGINGAGIQNDASTVVVADRCTFEGGSSIYNTNSSMQVGSSKLIGLINGGGGTLSCTACYNGNFLTVGTNCQ